MNYKNLMALNPTEHDRMINSQGQLVIFYAHPIQGDDWPVIVAFPDQKKSFSSNFHDTDDMITSRRENEPILDDEGLLRYGAETTKMPKVGTFYIIEDSPLGKMMASDFNSPKEAQTRVDAIRRSDCDYFIVQLIQEG